MNALVPVESLTDRSERFRCVPLSCELTAGACVDRQRGARARQAEYRATAAMEKGLALDAPSCVACPLGERVAARVGTEAPMRGQVRCGVSGCGALAARVGKRTPPPYARLCAEHRRAAATIRARRRCGHAEAARALLSAARDTR